jgi:UDPglucose 6-dehydrogenase
MKILVLGLGYVGTANAVLLAQHNDVVCYDLNQDRIQQINSKISPIEDKEVSEYLTEKKLSLKGVDQFPSSEQFDFVIIATPTNYDADTNYFDTSSVQSCIDQLDQINSKATIIIRSTLPVGFVKGIQSKYPKQEIIFVPEFIREGRALQDSLHPSRIVVGSHSDRAKAFANLLAQGALDEKAPVLYTSPTEAESCKLFANAYLAMRVTFFNELDSFAMSHQLDPREIIQAVSLDPRIGDYYNNPSFGYGGYCLPKDTKQLLRNFDQVPQKIMEAIIDSNTMRKDFLGLEIARLKPKCVGVYRLAMKEGSDNIRESSMQGIMKRVKSKGIPVIIYEPLIKESSFYNSSVYQGLEQFKKDADLILCNRNSPELKDVQHKIFTRDLFQQD